MLGRTAATTLVVATLIGGCMKTTSPQGAAQIGQLIEHIETVAQWSRGPDRAQHTAWLDRAIAWDIVGAVDMTTAAPNIDDSRVDAVLRSGLNELAAGPGDHVASLVTHWRKALGEGSCHSTAASDDDVRWARERLAMPVPRGAGAEVQRAQHRRQPGRRRAALRTQRAGGRARRARRLAGHSLAQGARRRQLS
jgi:hypothetical protein